MLQPEYATATAPLRRSTSRLAFSDAGHSVTSGLDWLAATRHFPCSIGARGNIPPPPPDFENSGPPAHAAAPVATSPTSSAPLTCDRQLIAPDCRLNRRESS